MALNVYRCAIRDCGSSAFFDWGIELLEETQKFRGIQIDDAGKSEELADWAGKLSRHHVKVCVLCFTPYIIEAGKLVNVSEEVEPEMLRGMFLQGPHKKLPQGPRMSGSGAGEK